MVWSWLEFLRPRKSRKPIQRVKSKNYARLAVETLEQRWVPTTLTVTNYGDESGATLRNLVGLAKSGDTIQIKGTQTITLSHGDIDINKNLTITCVGLNANTTIQQGEGAGYYGGRVFEIIAGKTVTFNNLTIEGGDGTDGGFYGDGFYGGGSYGGGFYNLSFENVANDGHGGGILNHGRLTLKSTTVQDNLARGDDGTGDTFTTGPTSLTETHFQGTDAKAGQGGGIYNDAGGVLILLSSEVGHNLAEGGDGFYAQNFGFGGSDGGDGGAGQGGGIFNNGGTVVLTNSKISGNQAIGGEGGDATGSYTYTTTTTTTFGSSCSHSTSTFTHTVPANGGAGGAGQGGGIFNDGGTVVLTRTVLGGEGGGYYGENEALGGDGGDVFGTVSGTDSESSVTGGAGGAGGAGQGGGIYSTDGTVTFNGNLSLDEIELIDVYGSGGFSGFLGNHAHGGAGGYGGDAQSGDSYNLGGAGGIGGAGQGGGIYVANGDFNTTGILFYLGNDAQGGDGSLGGDVYGSGDGGVGGQGGAGQGGAVFLAEQGDFNEAACSVYFSNFAEGGDGGTGGQGATTEGGSYFQGSSGNGGAGQGGGLYITDGTASIVSPAFFIFNGAEGGDGGDGVSSNADIDQAADGGDGGQGQGGAVYNSAGTFAMVFPEERLVDIINVVPLFELLEIPPVDFADAYGSFENINLGSVFLENQAEGGEGGDGGGSYAGASYVPGGLAGNGGAGGDGQGGAIYGTLLSSTTISGVGSDVTIFGIGGEGEPQAVLIAGNQAEGGDGGDGGKLPAEGSGYYGGDGGAGGAGQGGGVFVGGVLLLGAPEYFPAEATTENLSLDYVHLVENEAEGGQGGGFYGESADPEIDLTYGLGGDGEGGAIHLQNAHASLTHLVIDGNTARGADGASVNRTEFPFAVGSNGADGQGGGIFAFHSQFSLSTSQVYENQAIGGQGSQGIASTVGLYDGVTGGDGYEGGHGEGGGLFIDAEDTYGSSFPEPQESSSVNITETTIGSVPFFGAEGDFLGLSGGNEAIGGIGGKGGKGSTTGGYGGEGGFGAGGGVFIGVDDDQGGGAYFGGEGNVSIDANTIFNNLAVGGEGGEGGDGNYGGSPGYGGAGGEGGIGVGGGAFVGVLEDIEQGGYYGDFVYLANNTFAANEAAGGDGGIGGNGSTTGGNGGDGTRGYGGGIGAASFFEGGGFGDVILLVNNTIAGSSEECTSFPDEGTSDPTTEGNSAYGGTGGAGGSGAEDGFYGDGYVGGEGGQGGGIFNPFGQVIAMAQNIVANNDAFEGPDVYGSFEGGGYNLIENPVDSVGFATPTDIFEKDPHLSSLADHGGPTWTMIPLGGPAVDGGDPDPALGLSFTQGVDQRGVIRIKGAAIDIGAVEVNNLQIVIEQVGVPAAPYKSSAGTYLEGSTADDFGQLKIRVTEDGPDDEPRGLADVKVTFIVNEVSGAGATLYDQDEPPVSGTEVTVVTDADGYAYVTATANSVVGSYTVTAAVCGDDGDDGVKVDFSLTNVARVATSMRVFSVTTTTPNATTNGPGTNSSRIKVKKSTSFQVVLQTLDQFGDGIAGVDVRLQMSSPNVPTKPRATPTPQTGTTGAEGKYTFTLTANAVTSINQGKFQLVADAPNVELPGLIGPPVVASGEFSLIYMQIVSKAH